MSLLLILFIVTRCLINTASLPTSPAGDVTGGATNVQRDFLERLGLTELPRPTSTHQRVPNYLKELYRDWSVQDSIGRSHCQSSVIGIAPSTG